VRMVSVLELQQLMQLQHCLKPYFKDVDECTLIAPCKNQGQCLNLFGSFECLCPIPYGGFLCEERRFKCSLSSCDLINFSRILTNPETDPCKSYPCSNNGKCKFDAKNMTINCECTRYYDGEHCDERKPEL
jgi:hypothetical protein